MRFRAVPFATFLAAGVIACAVGAGAQIGPLRPGARQQPTRPVPSPRDTIPAARDSARRDSAAAPAETDTLVQRLLGLEGYTAIEYKADSAEFRGDERTLRLRGNPEVRREGQMITSRDSIVYRERSDIVAAYGQPRATGEGEPIEGDVMFYDLAARRSSVRGARTKITQNATWFVEGDVTEERGQRIFATGSTFTSDDRADPAYHFRADKIMIIRDRVLVGRPAYLYFKNVPVMALPFIVQDLERGRRSGFLIPQFEINDIIRTSGSGNERGTGREISNLGYYWAINQYLGLELAGRWRSGTYTALAGNLDFNVRRRFLNGQIRFENFWQEEGAARLNLNGGARWDYNERTNLALTLDFAKSTEFERNRTIDPQRQTQDLGSSFSLTRRLDWGNFTLNAERRQSLADDDVTFTPRFNLGINPITLFPSDDGEGYFYNDAVLNLSLGGSLNTRTPGEGLARREARTQQGDVSGSAGITFGQLGINSSFGYRVDGRDFLPGIDSASAEEGTTRDRLAARSGFRTERFNADVSTGYQINLIGSTYIAPRIGFSQEFVRFDSLVAPTRPLPDSLRGVVGQIVAGPPRLNIGATLNTDLYGFFGGFGPYSAIRHHIQPQLSWTYSPQVVQTDTARARRQRLAFGPQFGRTTNEVTLGFRQTFEAKLRDEARPVAGDTAADSTGTAGNAAAPADPRKITLLSINTTTPLTYTFEPDSLGGRFRTDQISNTITTDLLGGLQFTMSHDLFDDRVERDDLNRIRLRRGSLSPFLTSFSTGFTLGGNSALFRWLGFARISEEDRRAERGQTPDSAGARPPTPQGGATFTGNNQAAGGGPWSMSLNYSLSRNRRSASDTIPGFFDPGNQQIDGRLTFSPTKNWGVSWSTGYSLTEKEFFTHTINLKRDLYRWQANFDYIVAPNGNTQFAFSVHLIDLPDLKADYNEQNLGTDRRETTRRTTGATLP